MKRKIAYFFWSLAVGGAENSAFRLMQELAKTNWEIWIFYYVKAEHLEGAIEQHLNTFTHLHQFSPDQSPTKQITDFLQHHQIKLLHIIRGDYRIAMEIKQKKIPIQVLGSTLNTLPLHEARMGLGNVLTSICVKHVNDVAIVEKKDRTLKGKIVVIENGIDTTYFNKNRISQNQLNTLKILLEIGDCRVIGTVGNIRKAKNYHLLIEVLREGKKRNDNLKLLIVGDIIEFQEYSEIVKTIKSYELSQSVIFVGFQKDVRPYLKIIDIYLNSSLGTESSPNAILEAMSMEKPVIATKNVGIQGLIHNAVNGYVVEQRDTQAICRHLARLLSSQELLTRYGRASRKIVEEHYFLEKMVECYEAWYHSTLCKNLI